MPDPGEVFASPHAVPTVGAEAEAVAAIARMFAASATTSMPRAPLYAALSAGIAERRELSGLLLNAPETQRLPVLLFAASHFLLLDEPGHALAQWYPNLTDHPRSPQDPRLITTFERFVLDRRGPLIDLLRTRSTQTNEVGRCALFLPVFGLLHDEMGALGHLDVGASGGLNLLLDEYQYRYTSREESADGPTPRTVTVGEPSTVVLEAGTTGDVPLPSEIPRIRRRCGLDAMPIDVTDDRAARWLEACVWPDQADRFHRLRNAVELARRHPPELLAGDAVTALARAIEHVGHGAHPVVTNSWVLNYLTGPQRTAYLAELDRIGARRDLSWVYAEASALIPELPTGPDPVDAHRTVLSLARWREGHRTVEHLATCHPHGFWLHWR